MAARKSSITCAISGPESTKTEQGDTADVSGTASDPLNAGPCGDLLSGACWMKQTLFVAIIAVAVAAAIGVSQADRDVQTSFAIGCSLALLWEAPLSAPGWHDDPTALLRLLRPQAALLLAVWCCWDGIIFLMGEWLSHLANGTPTPGVVADLAVHVAWGQTSSLAVEVTAVLLGLWAYEPCGWNVSIARLPGGKHLTLLPQAIWLAASPAFVALSHLP